MKYGLPYKGSKNKLAERIVHLLPKRTHLIDLFCGGCAVTHAALLMKKYEHIHINDVNWMCPTLFLDALAGKYNNETRWISREDFFRLKDTDPYVAVVWSFGNNMRDYLYSKEIEPLKKAIHYAMFFSDYSLGKELGHDLSFIDPIKDMQKRYLAIKHYFNRLGHFQQHPYEGGVRCKQSITLGQFAYPQFGGVPTADAVSRECREIQFQSWNMGGRDSYRLETAERQLSRAVFKKKKIQKTQRTATQRVQKQPYIACNTESGNTPYITSIRGGDFYRLQAVCLITPMWRYRMIA